MKRSKSIDDALDWVAKNPPSSDAPIEMPVWELVSRELFLIANSPDRKVRGSIARATKAQKIILDRMVGRRRPGSHPAQVQNEGVEFVDLTAGELS